ncbi:MAG: Asp-tRNA(Asn)/Glu-tRNA(Gln) amidotransferase subunit GatB [Ruminococcaceae bacterium]|nr:Asp-tRNA(Asn)/Glu-tRNA(Gln) amidotransferase subunit GatB [Oscillospiraceae bacterium]
MKYETVCGLEIHTELLTKTKIFCSCSTAFGGEANTQCCEICTGMPGTLPSLNKKVCEFAVRTGAALHCEINRYTKFDRKNYFYPDLPKAYQISQLYIPICQNGYVEIGDSIKGGKKRVRIHEIHMEEDAGKLIHKDDKTLINFNRCGVPLLEIVTEPDISTGEEAAEFTQKLRDILRFCGVSDCKMQEGSLRADVNVSVRPKGSDTLGTRTEMKNINSFKAIKNAVLHEAKRQISVLECGGEIIQQTRRWDDRENTSYPMRIKENAPHYKYFPEPDIPPLTFSEEYIESVRATLPELPDEKKLRYITKLGLTEYDADIICSDLAFIKLFEKTAELTNSPKESANWIMGEVMRMLSVTQTLPENMNFRAESLGEIINLLSAGKITRSTAKETFEQVFVNGVDPSEYIKQNGLELQNNSDEILAVVRSVISANPKAVDEYLGGKQKAIGFLIGQAMKQLGGKASPNEVSDCIKNEIKT